jgi:Short-chain dehydrogenases of various substrate specificities
MNERNGKIAVVTGGNRGIGKAIAIAFASEGCRVAISGREETALEKTADELRGRFKVDVLAIQADARKANDAERMAEWVERELGPADVLVNNAGVGLFSDVARFAEDEFRAVFETNLFGVFYTTKAFLPGMIRHGGGHVINIGSLAGKNNFAGGSAYCASKHALISFAECLMLEVRHQNVKVTTICPGSVATDFSPESKGKDWALTGEDVAQAVIDVWKTSSRSLLSLVEMRPLKPKKS